MGCRGSAFGVSKLKVHQVQESSSSSDSYGSSGGNTYRAYRDHDILRNVGSNVDDLHEQRPLSSEPFAAAVEKEQHEHSEQAFVSTDGEFVVVQADNDTNAVLLHAERLVAESAARLDRVWVQLSGEVYNPRRQASVDTSLEHTLSIAVSTRSIFALIHATLALRDRLDESLACRISALAHNASLAEEFFLVRKAIYEAVKDGNADAVEFWTEQAEVRGEDASRERAHALYLRQLRNSKAVAPISCERVPQKVRMVDSRPSSYLFCEHQLVDQLLCDAFSHPHAADHLCGKGPEEAPTNDCEVTSRLSFERSCERNECSSKKRPQSAPSLGRSKLPVNDEFWISFAAAGFVAPAPEGQPKPPPLRRAQNRFIEAPCGPAIKRQAHSSGLCGGLEEEKESECAGERRPSSASWRRPRTITGGTGLREAQGPGNSACPPPSGHRPHQFAPNEGRFEGSPRRQASSVFQPPFTTSWTSKGGDSQGERASVHSAAADDSRSAHWRDFFGSVTAGFERCRESRPSPHDHARQVRFDFTFGKSMSPRTKLNFRSRSYRERNAPEPESKPANASSFGSRKRPSSAPSLRGSQGERAESLQLLGFGTNANPSEVQLKKAYRAMAISCHPDRPHNRGRQEEATSTFQAVKGAYDYLMKKYVRES